MLQYHVIRRAEDIEHVLRDRVALLPGVRDRENRPIIFVPARDVNSHPDHLHNLLTYLYDVTQDDAKPRGFTIVIDMRRGTTWEIVKPILKFLQEYFPAPINSLPKFIDFCQIIREFGGSMPYDHDEWIELRKDIERIVQRICEILKNLDRISTEMDNAEMPVDVQSSQAANAKHQDLYPIIAAVPIDEFKTEVQSLRDRVTSSGHRQSVSTRNVSVMTSPNPDLLSVFPQMDQLLQNLVIRRNNVYYKWDSRKNDLDRYCQLKLFEQDAEELSKWICSQFNVLTHRFVLIGESEMEANRLLKEHKDFADSVNKIQVSYEQVITVGHRLLQQFQSIGMNRIESISQQLQADWAQFVGRIEQRTALLQIALNMHRKCDTFLKNAELWLPNVGVDPHSIRSEDELPTAVQRHNEFQKLYQTAYSEAFEETNKLARVLRKYFGESALQLPAWELVEEQIRQITRTNRELHSIWEARNETIQIKASSTVFNQDLNSVLNWLTDHGEPFMRRKIGIGVDRSTAAQFCENHDKFRAVAHNTHRNAEQIFHMVQIIIRDSDESTRTETLQRVEELRRRIDKFRKCIEHRTNLLCLASNFFLHYEEIMQWYARMDSRMGNIRIVPNSVELCEQNKDKFQSENDGTVQAYERVMVEAQQLLQSLKQQRELLEVDNTEATVHVQTLTRNIENRHQHEKERWQEQRIYLSAALKISTFLRDCNEINKQLESWRQDLEGLKHSVTSTVEIIKQYHTQNTVKVQQVVSDAMKQLSEILQLIHAKNLQLLCAVEPSQPLKEMVTTAANRLHNLEQEVMHIAKDVSNRIELSIQLGKLRQIANGVIGAVEREQMRLMQLYFIPGNQQEVDMELRYFHEFRIGIESTEENVNRFYDEKEKFSNLLTLALESHAETRVKAENLCTEVKTKWQALVGLMDSRSKLLSAANSYYKYTRMLLPTSQSIENDLLGDGEKHFCKSRDWDTLQWCYEAIQERIEKHQSHKERFMEASVYAQRTADQFIRQIRRCDAPREHMEMRLFEVQRCKDTVRERQAFIFRLWMNTNAQLEHCRDATKIQLMVKEIVDWSDREMATCAKIKHTVDQLNKNRGDHRAKMEELLERCLEQWDLVKVERYETRKLLQETKHFMEGRLNELHVTEVKSGCSLAQIKFKNIWEMVMECEQVVRAALSLDEANIQRRKSEQEKLSLDRFSDSTIDEKLSAKECTADQDGENRKILEPMKELLKSEKDYIEDLRRCVDIYLYGYRTSGSMCPMAIRGKEREIFGNIEELYQFHCSVFLGELVAYAMNPEDVGYCFIEWMEKLKELYADYCLNKEENNYLICLPETIKMFNDIREQNGIELSHDLQSLVIKPVQRVTKYHILLKELLKHCAKNSKEIKNAYEIVLSIPKLANDRMHLKSFENSQGIAVGDFVMQDTFLVSEPKRYFKRERELQVFLFESNIVFTKKEELSSKKMGYVYKDSILLREVHVVEHIEGDITKFGLRKSAFPHQNDQNTTVLKANSEAVRISWKTDENSLTSAGGTNRSSRDSQSSITAVLSSSAVAIQATEDRNSAQSLENASCTATNNSVQRPHQQVVLRHEADTNGIVSFRGKPLTERSCPEVFEAAPHNSLSSLFPPTSSPLKTSSSMVDLLPSRFPTDVEDAGNETDDEKSGQAVEDTATIPCSSMVFTSIVEEDSEFYSANEPRNMPPPHSYSSQAQNQKRRNSTSNNNNNNNSNNLYKIFKTFRDQLERTKMTFRSSQTETEQQKERRRMANSRSFPISSSSMSSIHDYWKSLLQRESRSVQQRQERQWLVAEDFTADRPEQLCVISGQRVEMLSHQSDNGEFVRVTLLVNNNNNVSSSSGRTKSTGFVPRRILVAATASHTTPECGREHTLYEECSGIPLLYFEISILAKSAFLCYLVAFIGTGISVYGIASSGIVISFVLQT
uniref:Triple functional domain protein n=1 Tax=Globodera rostochiensis TaxID=31243 RepID=A0A914I119_GLORO